MPLTRNQITILHVAKNHLALDENTYRDALKAHAGVRSAKDLDYQGFRRVMKHFEACGFKRQGSGARDHVPVRRPGMATTRQIKKIYALWWSLGGSYYQKGNERKALRAFLKKRFRVDHENFLRPHTAWKVIEAIKAIAARGEKQLI